jgi:hypothetical protein
MLANEICSAQREFAGSVLVFHARIISDFLYAISIPHASSALSEAMVPRLWIICTFDILYRSTYWVCSTNVNKVYNRFHVKCFMKFSVVPINFFRLTACLDAKK